MRSTFVNWKSFSCIYVFFFLMPLDQFSTGVGKCGPFCVVLSGNIESLCSHMCPTPVTVENLPFSITGIFPSVPVFVDAIVFSDRTETLGICPIVALNVNCWALLYCVSTDYAVFLPSVAFPTVGECSVVLWFYFILIIFVLYRKGNYEIKMH